MKDYKEYFRNYAKKNFYEQALSDFVSSEKIFKFLNKLYHSKNILILGDKDADGITSTEMIKELSLMMDDAKKIETHIPSRYDGYGADYRRLKEDAEKYDLVVTVDNGSHSDFLTSILEDQILQNKVFIIDHHPNKDFIYKDIPFLINPNQDGSVSTSTGLLLNYIYECAYNLNQKAKIFKRNESKNHLVDIATISAIGDMADLNNKYTRRIIEQGFEKIKHTNKMLYKDLGKNNNMFMFLAFSIIPKINSVGRLAVTNDLNSIDFKSLFFTKKNSEKKDKSVFWENYKKVIFFDTIRKKAKEYFTNKIYEQYSSGDKNQEVFIGVTNSSEIEENCPIGVNGLVAQDMLTKTGVPSIILSRNPFVPEILYGSCRGKNLKQKLYEIKKESGIDFNFGGHNDALGVTVSYDDLDDFLEAVKRYKSGLSHIINFKDNTIVLSSKKLEQKDIQNILKEYQKASGGLPFSTDFYAPIKINSLKITKNYSGNWCYIDCNGMSGLCTNSQVYSVYNQNEDDIVLLKLQPLIDNFSFEFKVVNKDKLTMYMEQQEKEVRQVNNNNESITDVASETRTLAV